MPDNASASLRSLTTLTLIKEEEDMVLEKTDSTTSVVRQLRKMYGDFSKTYKQEQLLELLENDFARVYIAPKKDLEEKDLRIYKEEKNLHEVLSFNLSNCMQ